MALARRRKVALVALAGLLVAGAAVRVVGGLTGGGGGADASGTIEAGEVRVKAEVAGRILDVLVEEGQEVRAGQALVKLDPAVHEAQLRQADAAWRAAQARYEDAAAGGQPAQVRQARAVLDQALARRDEARRGYERAQALFDEGATTQSQLDAAASQLRVAEEQVTAAGAALDLARTGATSHAVDALKAAAEQAEAALSLARLNLEKTVVRAPGDGTVSVLPAEAGELVLPGAPVAVVADLSRFWVRVYLPVTELGRVKVGQAAEVQVDPYPRKVFRGRVASIASEAEFTPRNVQTRKERVNLVFAVKVTLDDPEGLLRPGLPADVDFPRPAGR